MKLFVAGTYLVVPTKVGRSFELELRPTKLKKKEEKRLRKIENVTTRDIYAIAKVSRVFYVDGSFYIL